ncbi:MAG: metal-dependent transcriptional regulator [Candidatus Omnitrophota bacterium]|nr:metal-dependent transcriptional regulator [Candidatus Omnitrophota bacterium]
MKKEDYLEELYKIQCRNNRVARVTELAHALKVSDSSVSEMIRRLQKEKLVTFERFGGISLTAAGIKEARKVIRKHQLLEVFFSKVLKIKTHSHEEAHLMEHVLSDAATDKLDSVLKKPKLCPDGNPIPEKNSEVVSLIQLSVKSKAEVIFVASKNKACLERLNSLGLVPQAKVRVVRKLSRGPLILNVKGSEIALGPDVCASIFVEKK